MFCIAAFIVLAIISIFSVRYRKMAKQAWSCTLHRVTFRPCDTSFKEETKSKLLSHVAMRAPKLVKYADFIIEFLSFVLVILTVWSLYVAMLALLNLFVWGTCNPNNASSCSLTSETCSIETARKGFWQLTTEGKPWQWFVDEAGELGNTIANIPTRLKNWQAVDYLPEHVSYYFTKDSSKPIALEVIDPGCSVCMKLFKNIKSADFESKYNLAYIAYPISSVAHTNGYKFKNSYLITTYLEALKLNPISGLKTPTDWLLIQKIFTATDGDGMSYQSKFNTLLSSLEAKNQIHEWLTEFGYSDEQIMTIDNVASSVKVSEIIKANRKIVENEIKTVKIPTIIFDGARRDGALTTDQLK